MHVPVREKLEELRTARNKTQGRAILQELLAFDDRRYLSDFVEIMTDDEYAKPEYSRRIPWDIRVHVSNRWLRKTDPRVFAAFHFMLDSTLPWARSAYLDHLARTGQPFALDSIERILFAESCDKDQRSLLRGIDFASKKECHPDFVAGVLDCLARYLATADEETQPYLLGVIKEFSDERYRELKRQYEARAEPLDLSHDYYALQPADPFWGDYGRVLIHGISWEDNVDEKTGQLILQRTGPFVPPITFPSHSDIVVTSEFRKEWERHGFTGAKFQPVIIRKLVRIPWETWDRERSVPEKLPAGGESENYLLRRKDNAALHKQVGELWQLIPRKVKQPGTVDIFEPKQKSLSATPAISQRAARSLTEFAAEWVTMTPID